MHPEITFVDPAGECGAGGVPLEGGVALLVGECPPAPFRYSSMSTGESSREPRLTRSRFVSCAQSLPLGLQPRVRRHRSRRAPGSAEDS